MIKKSLPIAMVFFSGLAALVYQVLWMRQLGLLFGNTAHASAVTLGAFFSGLAVGNWFWGRRMAARPNPLRVYAWLEVGIALSALLYFGVIGLFQLAYPWVYQSLGYGTALFAFKCLLAMTLVCPPAFFMGGTIPVMGQSLVVQKKLFGTTAARIYGINTLGAALGVFLAAFLCVPLLGFTITCICAMLVTSLIAAGAFALSRGWQAGDPGDEHQTAPAATESPETSMAAATAAMRIGRGRKKSPKAKKKRKGARALPVETAVPTPVTGLGRPAILSLAFLSGFSVLAMEVLWTRLFAQIHENSVYSFATVLIIVLVCLSLGALLAAGLAKFNVSSKQAMAQLLLLGGVSLALFPKLFLELTNDLTMLPTHTSFARYVGTLFLLGFSTIGPSCLLMGTVFPFLMKSEERFADCPGRSIGYVAAIDTAGAILGSLICGFLLLKYLGMWWTVRGLATLYLVAAVVFAEKSRAFGMALTSASAAFLILTYAVQQPGRLPVIGVNPNRGPHRIVETWETADCSIAVVENIGGHLAIKLNSNYILGSTDATAHQVLQARLPLLAYPDTKSIFFLGLGTGITAGGALDRHLFPAVERVVACELVPEVVIAAKKYMTEAHGVDYTHGLFEDPRVEILVEDGRHYLMATKETFDMINADLFLPYRSGAGSLYSRENYERAQDRLNDDGVYVQWLPLYQLTDFEFGTISRTMLSVFGRVTLWRNNFVPGQEIVALIGHKGNSPLPAHESARRRELPAAVAENGWRNPPNLRLPFTAANIMLFYAGNMTASKELFDSYPVNTDDRPIIEYRAPLSIRQKVAGGMPPTLVGPQLAAHIALLLDACPPDRDPMLANQTAANRRLPLAGAALHEVWIGYVLGDPGLARKAWNAFVGEWTDQSPH